MKRLDIYKVINKKEEVVSILLSKGKVKDGEAHFEKKIVEELSRHFLESKKEYDLIKLEGYLIAFGLAYQLSPNKLTIYSGNKVVMEINEFKDNNDYK